RRRIRVLRKPQLLGKADALQLAGGTFRDLGENHDLAGYFEVGQAYGSELAQIPFARFRAFTQHYGSSDVLAKLVVRNGERHALLHARVIHQHFVDFAWGNLFSAAIDDFLQPPGDRDVALG